MSNRQELLTLLTPLKFPASKHELMLHAPDVEITWFQADPITLKDAIAVLHPDHFDTVEELVDSLCDALKLAYQDYSLENLETIINP
jgi:hypothetical protein